MHSADHPPSQLLTVIIRGFTDSDFTVHQRLAVETVRNGIAVHVSADTAREAVDGHSGGGLMNLRAVSILIGDHHGAVIL